MALTTIRRVRARRVWDSRGRPTVEVDVHLDGGFGRAIAPAGASRGRHEAIDLRDGGARLGGFDVKGAVANVNGPIAGALVGLDAGEQAEIDAALIALDGTANKARLGGNATIATSLAALDAAARAHGLPVWQWLAGDGRPRIPLPQIQIFGGGAHAGRRVDVQDFMIVCVGAGDFAEALEWTAEVHAAAGRWLAARGRLAGVADEGGWWPAFDSNEQALEALVSAIEEAGRVPGDEIAIALDIAASEFGANGRYCLALDGCEVDSDGWIGRLGDWIARFPIVSVEDPLAEDDADGLVRFTAAFADRLQIVADDYVVTDARRIADAAAAGACNCALIKPNQAGTVSEARAALRAARAAGWRTIVSARSGETEDVSIAHLAVGWDAGQFKVGSFTRSERMAKWNEVLRIAEAMGADARFAGAAALRDG